MKAGGLLVAQLFTFWLSAESETFVPANGLSAGTHNHAIKSVHSVRRTLASSRRLWRPLHESMIETSRLILRPFALEDEGAAISLLMCPEFMAYSPTGALGVKEARQRFVDLVASHDGNCLGKLAVIAKSSGTLIGYCGIEMCDIGGKSSAELGFRLQMNYHGVGYATEAAAAVLERAEPVLGNVIAFTEPANEPSIRVLQKLGFRSTGESSFKGMAVVIFGRACNKSGTLPGHPR